MKAKTSERIILVLCIGFAAVAITFLILLKITEPVYEAAPSYQFEIEPEPVVVDANTRLLFAGTTFWGRRTDQLARNSELGISYPFSQLNTLNRENYDAWIAGLECPITDNGHNYNEENTIFKFNCDPDYLSEAKKYFTAFLLGNNHTDNQGGGIGLTTTRNYLDANGIQYFGTPKYSGVVESELARDVAEASNCAVIIIPLNLSYDNGEVKQIKMPFGFCSAHGVFGIPGNDYVENIKEYATFLPTIVMPHMGAEYQPSHDELRQNLFRRFIDYAGAESVIADHPHWIQDAEAYNDRLIVYSMGNFMFDQYWGGENSRSATIEANANFVIDEVDFESWDVLSEACLEDKINCLVNIKAASLPKPTIKWTYDYHATTSEGDCITRLANEAEQFSVGERLRWAEIPATLKIR